MSKTKEAFMEMREQEIAELQLPSPSQSLSRVLPTLKEFDKIGIEQFAMAYVDKYTDGTNSPTEGLGYVKKLIDFAELAKANLQDHATNELKLGKGEKANIAGMTVSEQMTGVRYDYSACKDPVWNELNEKIKAREKELQSITTTRTEIIEATGEVVTIYPPAKSGKMSLIFKY